MSINLRWYLFSSSLILSQPGTGIPNSNPCEWRLGFPVPKGFKSRNLSPLKGFNSSECPRDEIVPKGYLVSSTPYNEVVDPKSLWDPSTVGVTT